MRSSLDWDVGRRGRIGNLGSICVHGGLWKGVNPCLMVEKSFISLYHGGLLLLDFFLGLDFFAFVPSLRIYLFYYLRSILLITQMDVCRCISVLNTTISATSYMDRREYMRSYSNFCLEKEPMPSILFFPAWTLTKQLIRHKSIVLSSSQIVASANIHTHKTTSLTSNRSLTITGGAQKKLKTLLLQRKKKEK